MDALIQECSESRCSLHDDYEGCNCQVAEGVANRTILCHTCCKKIGMFIVYFIRMTTILYCICFFKLKLTSTKNLSSILKLDSILL